MPSQFTPSGSDLYATPQASMRLAIVRTLWNAHITGALCEGAVAAARLAGLEPSKGQVEVFEVPGAVELTFAASRLMDTGLYDAIIVLGCVIRGGTPHFDYVCQSVTQGITALNAAGRVPVIFGVLTVNNEQEALDRAGGPEGHKGIEAAETAIRMVNFARSCSSS